MIEKQIRFFAIDAYALAKQVGMGGRINTIMQTCFFGISGILPREEAIAHIKKSIEKTYGKRGPEVVRRNCEVVDLALAQLHEIPVPAAVSATRARPPIVSERAPDFVQKITAVMLAGKGDLLPVSAFTVDGTWPVGTAKWEKRNRWKFVGSRCAFSVIMRPGLSARRDCARCGDRRWRCLQRSSQLPERLNTKASSSRSGRPGRCTGCNLCVNVCPPRTGQSETQSDQYGPQAPLQDNDVNYDSSSARSWSVAASRGSIARLRSSAVV